MHAALMTHNDHAQCTFLLKFQINTILCFFFNSGHFHLSRAYFRLKWNMEPKSQKQIQTFNNPPYECAGQQTNYEFVFQFSYYYIFTK